MKNLRKNGLSFGKLLPDASLQFSLFCVGGGAEPPEWFPHVFFFHHLLEQNTNDRKTSKIMNIKEALIEFSIYNHVFITFL